MTFSQHFLVPPPPLESFQRNNFLYGVFYVLGEGGFLHANNVEMILLHYIFLPRINFSLGEFFSAPNLRPVTTRNNWSPNRIWATGVINHNFADPIHPKLTFLHSVMGMIPRVQYH